VGGAKRAALCAMAGESVNATRDGGGGRGAKLRPGRPSEKLAVQEMPRPGGGLRLTGFDVETGRDEKRARARR
jgi:hypothetical protein